LLWRGGYRAKKQVSCSIVRQSVPRAGQLTKNGDDFKRLLACSAQFDPLINHGTLILTYGQTHSERWTRKAPLFESIS
jgi:hypothetical protein